MSQHRSALILGAANSGKSRFAEQQARQQPQSVIYIATACPLPDDDAWQQRIDNHRQRRPGHWKTVESPYNLSETIGKRSAPNTLLLVDCLTVWLSNLMLAGHDIDQQERELCHAITHCCGNLILVSNEVGMGVVPDHPLGRQFRDAQGMLNQSVAACCDRVEMVISGLPLRLKG